MPLFPIAECRRIETLSKQAVILARSRVYETKKGHPKMPFHRVINNADGLPLDCFPATIHFLRLGWRLCLYLPGYIGSFDPGGLLAGFSLAGLGRGITGQSNRRVTPSFDNR